MSAAVLALLLVSACADPTEESGEAAAPPGPIIASSYRFVFGDLHVHTGASGDGCSSDVAELPNDTCGALADLRADALAAGLDFEALTDHTDGPKLWKGAEGSTAWRATVDAAFAASDETFVALPGAEVSTTVTGAEGESEELGHKSLLFFGDEAQLAGLTREDATPNQGSGTDVGSCQHIAEWALRLQDRVGPLALVPHHTATVQPMATDFSCFAEGFIPGVELYSHWGSSRIVDAERPDYDQPVAASGGEPELVPSGATQFLLTAYPSVHVGFLGGTDAHATHAGNVCRTHHEPGAEEFSGGLTGAWFPEDEAFDRTQLHDAIRARHTLVTSGPRVPAFVRVLDAAGETIALAGDEVAAAAVSSLRVEVSGPIAEEVTAAWAITAGEGIGTEAKVAMAPDGGGWSVPWAPKPGHFVYVMLELSGPLSHPEGCVDGGLDDTERVWVSPTWFR